MNLNNWLCKHFDEDRNGYVTIGDIILNAIVPLLGYIFIGWAVLWVCGFIVSIGANLSYLETPPTTIYDFLFLPIIVGWDLIVKYLAIPIIILVIGIYILYEISQIKIAKCPLKEDDTK